jgi:putative intracellular protease/amidase
MMSRGLVDGRKVTGNENEEEEEKEKTKGGNVILHMRGLSDRDEHTDKYSQ